MQVVRKPHHKPILFWLLILSLGLRSLIAPGFMLDTRGDGPLGLGIVFCGGLNGINSIAGIDDPHSMHQDSDGDTDNHAMHDGLYGPGCGLWSASGTYVEPIVLNSDGLLQAGPDQFQLDYISPDTRVSFQFHRPARAPPVTRII